MPALSDDSLPKTWSQLYAEKGSSNVRQVNFLDNLATLWRAEWFESIGLFDADELRGFGPQDLRSYGLEDAHLERATNKVPLRVVVGAICTHARLVRTLVEDHGREGVLAQELLLAPVVTTGVQPVLAAEFVESR